jgi:hypothetical protein
MCQTSLGDRTVWWRRLGRRWHVLRGCARTSPTHQRYRRTVQPIPAQLPWPVADVGRASHRGLVPLDTESLDTEDGGHVSDSSVRVRPPLARRVVEAMAVEVGGMDSSAAPSLAQTAARPGTT